MAEFKNKEEYEKWKAEKGRRAQDGGVEKKSTQDASTMTLSKNVVILGAIILVVVTAIAIYFIAKPTSQAAKHEEVPKVVANVSASNSLSPKSENAEKKVNDNIGKVTGNVFATMQSGDVKRAAGTEIILMKDNGSLISDYEQIKQTCREEIRPLFDSYMKVSKEISDVLTPGRYNHGSFMELEAEKIKRQKMYEEAKDRCFTKIRALFASNMFQKANTDVNGYYTFSNIPFGKFYVFSQFEVFSNKLEWLEPIDLNSNEAKLDLTNSNKRNVITY